MRLERHHQSALRVRGAHGLEGRRDLARMMPVVIDQDEAAFRQRQFAVRLATTTDTAKAGQRTTHRIERHTELASDRDRRQRVLDIVLAWPIEMKGFPARFGFAVVEADREMRAAAFGDRKSVVWGRRV